MITERNLAATLDGLLVEMEPYPGLALGVIIRAYLDRATACPHESEGCGRSTTPYSWFGTPEAQAWGAIVGFDRYGIVRRLEEEIECEIEMEE